MGALAALRSSLSNIGQAPIVHIGFNQSATENTVQAAARQYHARMQRVLDHIDHHLDGDLSLESLSAIAAFSKYHFQRQFAALFGIGVHRYVQLIRIKRASYQLAFRSDVSVTEIAMDAGYDAPEAFARAFRQRFGQAPTEFRKAPQWTSWQSALGALDHARNMQMQESFTPDRITIVDFPETPVAIMEHRGDPARIGETIRRFIAWRRQVGLSPKSSATFNIFHTDPENTAPEDFRMDLCAATTQPIPSGDPNVRSGVIPAGRCAMLRLIGSSDNLGPGASCLYGHWLPASGEETRNFPFYCQRLSFFPDVHEHEAVTDLFLPLADAR